MNYKKIILLFFLGVNPLYSTGNSKSGTIDYSQTVSSSEVSRMIFGPSDPLTTKKVALDVGRAFVGFGTDLNCGKLSLNMSIEGELNRVNEQLKESVNLIEKMVKNPMTLALGFICYYKKNTCSRIRHLHGLISENFKMELNACRAFDNYVDNQAQKGLRSIAFEDCMKNKNPTSINVKKCRENARPKAYNLLQPFNKKAASGRQDVLKTLLKVALPEDRTGKSYTLMARLLGEVRLRKNGAWVSAFPQGMLRPDQAADNIVALSNDNSCDLNNLEQAIQGGSSFAANVEFGEYVQKSIRENLDIGVVKDLRSIPVLDKNRICSNIGVAIADIATKKMVADGHSKLAAATKNDALSKELKIFFTERGNTTFAAIEKEIASKKYVPLKETRIALAELAKKYRGKNREILTESIGRDNHNKSFESNMKCVDQMSCVH